MNGHLVRRDLRKPGFDLILIQEENASRFAAELDSIDEEQMIVSRLHYRTDETLWRCTRVDDMASKRALTQPGQTLHHCFRQMHAQSVIAIIDIAEPHQTYAALNALPQLFVQVRHQISSPSVLICS